MEEYPPDRVGVSDRQKMQFGSFQIERAWPTAIVGPQTGGLPLGQGHFRGEGELMKLIFKDFSGSACRGKAQGDPREFSAIQLSVRTATSSAPSSKCVWARGTDGTL
jgi:hypothetical protein